MPDDDDYVNIQYTAGRVSAESRRRRIRDREAGNQTSSLETYDFDRERAQVGISYFLHRISYGPVSLFMTRSPTLSTTIASLPLIVMRRFFRKRPDEFVN